MTEPLVTIVVPAYRRVDYLPLALASAVAQTFSDFEIIVSDDGPSDAIARIAASFEDPRIRYRSNERNQGIAMNHYAAYREARGRYLANLDDDDLWEPTFLAELVPALEADPSVSVAFCDHHLIEHDGTFIGPRTERNSRIYRRSDLAPGRHQPFREMAALHETIPIAMGSVFRRSILDGAEYPAQIGGCYDHWLAYLATRDGAAIFYCPRRLTRYRVHAASGSATRGLQNLRNGIYVRSRLLKDPRLARCQGPLRNTLGVFYGKMALHFIEKGKFRRAWILEKHALSLLNRPKPILGLIKNTLFQFLKRFRKGPASQP
jgi:glycosyltransferase involved in cell wall biosynthesis